MVILAGGRPRRPPEVTLVGPAQVEGAMEVYEPALHCTES